MARDNEPGMPRGKKQAGGSGRWSKYTPADRVEQVSWASVSESLLSMAVEEVTGAGAALLLSRSRDGGTLVLTLCDGDDRQKYYGKTAEEMQVHLNEIIKA